MKLGDALNEALDEAPVDGATTVHAEAAGGRVEIDVVDADRLGVRVSRVKVEREHPYDVEAAAERWTRELRDLPDRVSPVEVDARLGGATLRSRPEEMRDDRFIDIEIRGRTAEVRRHVRRRGGPREAADFTVTREQLGRMVDDLARGGSGD